MSLKDRLAVAPSTKSRFELAVEELPAAEREALIEAAREPAWSSAALIRALAEEGVVVGKDSFAKWRSSVAG